MEEVIIGLLRFAKEHTEEDIESVCHDLVDILDNYDRRPKDFNMLYRKLDEYMEKKRESGDVCHSEFSTPVKYNKDSNTINIKIRSLCPYIVEYKIEFEFIYINKCKVIKFLQDDDDLLSTTTCYVTLEEAYKMIEDIVEGNIHVVYKKIGYRH